MNDWNHESVTSYLEWCARRSQSPVVMARPESDGMQGGQAIARQLLELPQLPDALYCLTGRHAHGVLTELMNHGIRVPEDFLLLAGSDCEQTRSTHPRISSIDLGPETLALKAVDVLAELLGLDGEPATPKQVGRLRARGSTQR